MNKAMEITDVKRTSMASVSPRDRVRLAIFGVGRIGNTHLMNLIRAPDRVELLYIVDLEANVCQELVNKYNLTITVPLATTDANKVFKDERVDAVVVCTPTNTHADLVIQALQHGKGVFCEKPLADSLEEIQECYKVAKEANRPLLCGFNRRFDPTLSSVKERINNGDMGALHVVKTTSRGHPKPSLSYLRTSGGFYRDAVIHDLDLVCWLIDDRPVTVFAHGYAHNPDIAALGDIDTTAVILTFPSGVIATIDASRYASYGYDQRIEVFGSSGQVCTDNHHVTSIHDYTSSGVQTDKLKHSLLERYAESYFQVGQHFLDVMQGISQSKVTEQQTVDVYKLSLACERSRESGQPIKIDYGN